MDEKEVTEENKVDFDEEITADGYQKVTVLNDGILCFIMYIPLP